MALSAEEMLVYHLGKLETLEGRRISFADTADIHHGAVTAALLLIQQQQTRIDNLEKLILQIDRKVNR